MLGNEDGTVRFDDVNCLFRELIQGAVIRLRIDRADIESTKSQFEQTLEARAAAVVADACMAMDQSISKKNYLWMYRWLVQLGRRRSRTSAAVPDGEAARMDGSNIGETSTSRCE